MNPSRILPDLQCSVVCEDVRQEIHGSFTLVGVLGYVRVPQLPVTVIRLCVFNRWTTGLGQFTECVRLLAPDQNTVLRKRQARFKLDDASEHVTSLTVFPQVQFTAAGAYSIEVLVDDVMKIRFPLPVILVPPPKPPETPAPETPPPPMDRRPGLEGPPSGG
jgi:hypothetical protein